MALNSIVAFYLYISQMLQEENHYLYFTDYETEAQKFILMVSYWRLWCQEQSWEETLDLFNSISGLHKMYVFICF